MRYAAAIALSILLSPGFFETAQGEPGGRHEEFTLLLRKYVSDGLVDYEGFATDRLFEKYLSQLAGTNPDTLPGREEKLAFWINAYNAYTIKLIVDRMPIESIRDIGLGLPVLFGPWSIEMANVGGVVYTLNAIEHDIIRDQFRDPRIHFALVCASKSCPKLRAEAYEGSTLDDQLDEEARNFINDTTVNRFDPSHKKVFLSKIFDWYQSDFEENAGSLRLFLVNYMPSGPAADLLWSEDVEIEYLPYDWSLNAK